MKRVLLLTTALLLAASMSFAGDTVIQEIVARVNNSIITRAELQRNESQTLQELRDKNATTEQVSAAEKNVLRDLIDQQLLIQKGTDLGYNPDTDLIKRLDEIRKQMKLETMEDLEKAAASQGVSYEDFKQNMRNQLITQYVVDREIRSKIQVTGEEIQKFYNEHKKEFDHPERVSLEEILISTQALDQEGKPTGPKSDDEIKAASAKADKALAELKKGARFEVVAQQYSEGPTAQQGGDLGTFERGKLAKELEDRVFAMKSGEHTDIIRTKQGFMILKVAQHLPAGVPPLKDVEAQIQDAIGMQKMTPRLRDYLTKLREDAYIDIKPGYVDSGASPNQTKPVITSADTNAKGKQMKKKKHKKLLIF